MKPADKFIFILLRGNIKIPAKIKEWFVANLPPTEDDFDRHYDELEQGKGYYLHLLTSDYKRYKCKQEFKDIIDFFLKEVRGKLSGPDDIKFYSVILKICLDRTIESHNASMQKVNTIVY